MSLRVRKPVGRCKVVVKQAGRELKTVSMPKAIPAEMIQFRVKAEAFVSSEPVEVMINE